MAISIYKCTEQLQNQIIAAYKNNISLRQIEKDFDVSRKTISKFLEEKGIKTVKGNHYRKYFHNFDFFEKIDSEEKAYWLGFMFADGYIVNYDNYYGEDVLGLSVSLKDQEVLEKFKKSIQATNPIKCYQRKRSGEPMVRLQMSSQKTVNDLISHGCVKQKSLILQPPKEIPEELLPHFIRGLFDGDGCITSSLKGSYESYQVDITSTFLMVNWIKEKVGMGSIVKDSRREKTYYYTLGGNQQVIKFYHYLYNNATIYLNRKYNKFQQLLNKYDESRGSNV